MSRRPILPGAFALALLAFVFVRMQSEGPSLDAPVSSNSTSDGGNAPPGPREDLSAEFLDGAEAASHRRPSPSMPTERRIPALPEGAPPGIFRVHVLGPEGEAVSGATVLLGSGRSLQEFETDDQGLATFPSPRSRTTLELRAHFEDRAAIPKSVASELGSTTLHLFPVEEIRGRVVDVSTDEPLSDVEIRVRQPSGPLRRETTTDRDGAFALDSIPKGTRLRVWSRKRGFAEGNQDFASLDDPAAPSPELVIRLVPSRNFSGHVVDAFTGQAIHGASVHATASTMIETRESGIGGEFLFEDIASEDDERLRAWVDAPGYCRMLAVFHGDEWRDALRIRLVPAAIFHVSAVDANGEPLPEARIRQNSNRPMDTVETPPALADHVDEGWEFALSPGLASRLSRNEPAATLEVECVPYSQAVSVHALLRGYPPAYSKLPRAGAPSSHQDFHIILHPEAPPAETSRIHGTLRINGEPAPGRISWKVGAKQRFGAVADDGSFELDGVDPGMARLQPFPKGSRLGMYFYEGMPFADRRPSVQVVENRLNRADVDVQVPMGSLAGRVQGTDGAPVAGRSVRIESIPWPLEPRNPTLPTPFVEARTDEEGRFELSVPTELAPYRVSLVHGGETKTHEVAQFPAGSLQFELPPTRDVLLHVRDTRFSRPTRFLDVYVRPSESEAYHALEHDPATTRDPVQVDSESASIRFALPLGTYDFLVSYPSQLQVRIPSVVLELDDAPYEIEVELPEAFRLDLVLAENTPPIPEDLTVVLLEDEHWDAIQDPDHTGLHGDPYPAFSARQARGVRFGSRRRALMGNLPPGRYRFKVFPPDIAIEPEYIEMGSSDQRVELRWE